jgi:hypothetical protein
MSIAYQCVSARLQYGCSKCAESSTRARDEVAGVGEGMSELDVGRVSLDLEELVVGRRTVVVRGSCYSHY